MQNHEYDDYRPTQYAHSVAPSSAQTPISGFNPMYDPSRSGMVMGGIAYDPMYTQGLQPQGFESRQMSPFPVEYRQHGQQATSVPPPFGNPSGYVAPHLHHTSSFTSQPDNNHGGYQNRHVPGGDWTQAFQGLSLGR